MPPKEVIWLQHDSEKVIQFLDHIRFHFCVKTVVDNQYKTHHFHDKI